jgi:hypothetical protein
MSGPKQPRNDGSRRIANMRTHYGRKQTAGAIFFDRNGNPIPNSEVIREVDEGWRHFWRSRGGVPVLPKMGGRLP